MTDSSAKPPLPDPLPTFKMPPKPTVGELAAIFARELHPAVDRHTWSANEAYAALGPHKNNIEVIVCMFADNPGKRKTWLDIYVAKVFSEWKNAAAT